MITAQPQSFFRQKNIALRLILVFVLGFTVNREHLCSNQPFVSPTTSLHSVPSVIHSALAKMSFDGNLSFDNIEHAARDFGNRYHIMPYAVLYPKSVSDISSIIKCIFHMGLTSELTVAARGRGHSLMLMSQLESFGLIFCRRVLNTGWHQNHGLIISISQLGVHYQMLELADRRSDMDRRSTMSTNCSEGQNAELFHAVLGGLGQFGIITQARIALEAAPKKVKWIRALYSDFSAFTKDQEHLISSENTFDYIEGFVIINRTGLLNYWRSSFKPKDPVQANQFSSEGKILFCLEVAKYFDPEGSDNIDQEIDTLLSKLNYIKSTLFWSEVPYTDFLDRVHSSEIKLREKGLWEVPHPWLNLLVPRSRIHEFAQEVFGNIVKETSNGPVLIYPVDKSRWKTRTSMITPDEDVFYLVAFLASAMPSSRGKDGFGSQWEVLTKRKLTYDPLAILAPGQKIFPRANALTRQ